MISRGGRIRPLAVVFISLLAVVSVGLSGLPSAAKILLALAVVLAAWRRLSSAVTHAIRLDRSASAALDGVRGNLSGEAVTGLFVALKLVSAEGLTRRALVFRDELDSNDYRALLAYLRHG